MWNSVKYYYSVIRTKTTTVKLPALSDAFNPKPGSWYSDSSTSSSKYQQITESIGPKMTMCQLEKNIQEVWSKV
jgi:hypothetical protein